MIEVVVTDEFKRWYEALDLEEQLPIDHAVDLLAQRGVALGFPHSSNVESSKHALRELRVQAKGRPVRIFYAFDPVRQAVLLIGADQGGQDKRFYQEYVPKADAIWEQYLRERKADGEGG